ncbi:SdiA-regulated domain-containing protein [Amycolatopsis sp. NPDC004378]
MRTLAVLAVTALTLSGAPAAAATTAWPGSSAVHDADAKDTFGENLSGLSFESPAVLWAVRNGPGTLYRLVPDGANWTPDGKGRALHYADGGGDPDAEGVVRTGDGVFAATERDNDDKDRSLQQILRYDPSSDSPNATGTWNLTTDLPDSEANKGIEAISWIPDSHLTAHGFRDDHTGAAYTPATYPNHGQGLYLVGLESTGAIYAYALDLTSDHYTRVATFPSGLPAVMDLEFEPQTGHLWAECDNTCHGQSTTLDISPQGQFTPTATYARPSGMPDYNNEGFAIGPSCQSGTKPVLWSDDSADKGHALRGGTLPCS